MSFIEKSNIYFSCTCEWIFVYNERSIYIHNVLSNSVKTKLNVYCALKMITKAQERCYYHIKVKYDLESKSV